MLKTFTKNKNQKAFTLVETLTAMTIIILAILGPLTVAVYSFSYATETRDNITATYLAGEAIELLRYKRDSIHIDGTFKTGSIYAVNPWSSFKNIFGTQSPVGGCYIDPTTHIGNGCAFDIFTIDDPSPIVACPFLYRNEAVTNPTYLYSCNSGLYSSPDNVKTSFSRNVKMENIVQVNNPIPDEDDIRVTSTVTYKKSNGLSKNITVIDFIHRR